MLFRSTLSDTQTAAYASFFGADAIDSNGNILQGGKVIADQNAVKTWVNSQNPYWQQLMVTTTYENMVQSQNEYESISENIIKANECLRNAIIQRNEYLANNPAPPEVLNEPQKPQEPDTSNLSDEAAKNAMEQFINATTQYNIEKAAYDRYISWKQDMDVFDSNVISARNDYDTYNQEREENIIAYEKAAGIKIMVVGKDASGNDIIARVKYDTPGDDDGTIQVNGEYINKYGKYVLTKDINGKECYEFKEQDMSDYYDLITQKMNDKLDGAKFKKKLEMIKEDYSVESKKIDNK